MSLSFVISDVDGTLVNHDKKLTPATIAAVARLQAAGVPFTIISARPPSGIAFLVEALKPSGPIAAFNGGTVIAPDGSVVERHTLDRAAAEQSFAIAGQSGATPWIFAKGRWHIVDPGNPHVPHEVLASGQQPLVETDMTPLFGEVDKLTWVSDDHDLLLDLQAKMRAAFGGDATIGMSQTYYLDLTHPLANKGDGVATLARIAGIDLTAVAVLGDQYNDVPMFERAGIAIAMGQAPEPVKAKADYVSTSNDEDGVAHAIDTILFPMLGDDMKKLIAFDLDGTLALSKQPLDDEMADLLAKLTHVAMVDIISGGDWPQFEKQVVSRMPGYADLDNFIIQPTTGTKLYRHHDGKWEAVYAELFTPDEGKQIRDALKTAVEQAGYANEQTWGEQIEDRGSQVTFSALGQQAPLEAKDKWDPDHEKRKKLQAILQGMLPDLSINIGGSTSIDITRKGVDKAYGLKKLSETVGVDLDAILFLGDAIFPGGNDYPAKTLGLDTVRVRDVQETKSVITGLIACMKA